MFAQSRKIALLIPLAIMCLACFSKNSFSQKFEKNGKVVTYRSNKFEYNSNSNIDTEIRVDPISGKEVVKYIRRDPVPAKMNGITIYGSYVTGEPTSYPEPYPANGSLPEYVTRYPEPYPVNRSLADYIFRNLSKDLDKLPDGRYRICVRNLVVNPKGKIVYYEYRGKNHKAVVSELYDL